MKRTTDILAMFLSICAIITGLKLHRDVHHLFVYDNRGLWTAHEIVGLMLYVFITMHCFQHKHWFKNFGRIKISRKWLNSLLFVTAVIVLVSGVILMSGSNSQFVSISHYITAIAFFILAIIHVVNRWKIFRHI